MNLPTMNIAQVQSHFVSPLSQTDIERYQKRLDIAKGIEWKDGAYYAIGDEDDSPGSYALYLCRIENGVVYLGEEDGSGEVNDLKAAYFVLYAGCAVIPQC